MNVFKNNLSILGGIYVGVWPSSLILVLSIHKVCGSRPARSTFGKCLKTMFHGSTQAM